jgi:MoxR-like ATPase
MGAPLLNVQNNAVQDSLHALLREASHIFLGKDHEVKLALCCLLARGHLLIEDVPGVGKTTLIKLLAKLLDLPFNRVQFTNDLLPADITGTTVFDQKNSAFTFHKGPLFSNFLLADELNRATPKTQSALLQAMEEGQVSLDGKTYPLPRPFFVVATQNPIEQVGTFALPESQLDRFLMRIEIGYPDRKSELNLLLGESRSELLENFQPREFFNLFELQEKIQQVHVAQPIADYVLDILLKSRTHKGKGLSPRAGLGIIRAAKSWAFMHNREIVIPEDVQATAPSVINHRLWWLVDQIQDRAPLSVARDLVLSVPIR